jgi:hypothetical protein
VLNFLFSFGVIFSLNREDKKEKLRNKERSEEIKKEAEEFVESVRSQ